MLCFYSNIMRERLDGLRCCNYNTLVQGFRKKNHRHLTIIIANVYTVASCGVCYGMSSLYTLLNLGLPFAILSHFPQLQPGSTSCHGPMKTLFLLRISFCVQE